MLDKIKERRKDKQELYKQVVIAGGKPERKNMFRCFKHQDKTASAWIKCSKEGFWYFRCFTCNFWMDAWDLEALNTGKDVRELIKEAVGTNQTTQSYYYKTTEELLASVDAIDIEEVNPYTNPNDGNIDLVTIRYLPRGGAKKQYAQAYQTDKGFVKRRPAGLLPLFNRARLVDESDIIYVEGEKCVRCLTKLGFTSTTGSGGASNAESHDYTPLAGKNVFLWPDKDEAGKRYMEQVRDKLLALDPAPTVYFIDVSEVDVPENGGDVADLIEKVKAEGGDANDCKIQIELILSEANESNRLESLETLLDDMREGRYTNMPIMDMPILTNEAKMLINKKVGIIYGNAGFGKSLFVSKLADDLGVRGHKVARLQLEDELELHLLRSFAQQAEKSDLANSDWHRMNPEFSKEMYEEYKRTLDVIATTLESGEHNDWNVQKLLDWAELKLKAGCELIVIDPVSVIMSDKVWIDSHKLMWGLKRLLAQYPNGRVVLVAHPNKDGEVGGGQAYKRFCHTLLILNRFKAPKDVLVLDKNGEQKSVTAEASIGISKTRYGKGNGLEIAIRLNPDTLSMEELGVILKDVTETTVRSPRGRDLEKENVKYQGVL